MSGSRVDGRHDGSCLPVSSGSEKSEEKRKVSQLSKVATCCTTLRPTMDKQV